MIFENIGVEYFKYFARIMNEFWNYKDLKKLAKNFIEDFIEWAKTTDDNNFKHITELIVHIPSPFRDKDKDLFNLLTSRFKDDIKFKHIDSLCKTTGLWSKKHSLIHTYIFCNCLGHHIEEKRFKDDIRIKTCKELKAKEFK